MRFARDEDPTHWLAALQEGNLRHVSILKTEGRSRVLAAEVLVDGTARKIIIKTRALVSIRDRLCALLGVGKFDRQWKGAALLAMKRIRTAQPIAFLRSATEERLVLESLPGRHMLHHIAETARLNADLSVKEQHQAASQVGRTLARLTASHLFNRDAKPSNWMLWRARDGLHVAMIDTEGIRRGQGFDRMLASLVIEPIGVNCRPRKALMARVIFAADDEWEALFAARPRTASQRRADRTRQWQKAGARVSRHGNPRPKVDPLE